MARRSKGEGSIYRRKDGRRCEKYTDANGKTRYIYAKTKAEISTKLTKAVADKDAGVVYNAGTLSVGEYLDKWLDSVKDTLRSGAFRRYEKPTRIPINPELGKVRLSRLNTLQLQDLYRKKLDAGLSARTAQIILATLHKALKQAVR